MIELTRLNGSRLAVNCDLILFAEAAPDTLLTMVTGEKLIVTEGLTEVTSRIVQYRARTMAQAARMCPDGLKLTAGAELPARAACNAMQEEAGEGDDALDEESAELMRRRRRSAS